MYKIYFKQAVEMLKQNRFMSIISIGGTALAIMMIMVIVVVREVKVINAAPEINRSRTMYVKWQTEEQKDKKNTNSGPVKYDVIKNYLYEMKTPEVVSAQISIFPGFINNIASSDYSKEKEFAGVRFVDANFWKIMSFSFVGGNSFTQTDFDAGLKKAVISESFAKKLFTGENPVGKTVEIDFEPYTVAGVVKDVSSVFNYSYGDLWVPYTTREGYDKGWFFKVVILAKDKKDFDVINNEIREIEKKYSAANDRDNLILRGPYSPQVEQIEGGSNGEPDVKAAKFQLIFILSILVLIPSVNLLSFSMSRIKKRTGEIGIRKAFGAQKHVILIQVLYENMITSLIGGIIGLLISYIVVVQMKEWLLGITASSTVPLSTLVSPWIFLSVFLVCFLFNILSAGIPAYRASRMSIVDSLNKND